MSNLETHERQCIELFGQPFTEIHRFLDQYFNPLDHEFGEIHHRPILHNLDGIYEAYRAFGEIAMIVATVHILEDCIGYIPRKSDYQDGTVDVFGRPVNQAKMDTRWFERIKEMMIVHKPD